MQMPELVSCAASTPLVPVSFHSYPSHESLHAFTSADQIASMTEAIDPRGGLAMWSSPSLPDEHTGRFPVAAP